MAVIDHEHRARSAWPAGRPHVVGRLRGLSIVLPCHDEAENVERTIDEATAAGELVADAHEILVVDDGSTDATREIAEARAAEDPRVRVLVHEVNRGYGAALRTGFAAAFSRRYGGSARWTR